MITYGGRFRVSLDTYHAVPKGWSKAEVIAAHRGLSGVFPIEGPEAHEPGAPKWLPDRKNWLQYRATLYRVAAGIRANDPACIELGLRYIELRYIGSYSGFIRARLARALTNADVSAEQAARLNRVFLAMVESHDYTEEFRPYVKLWLRIVSPPALEVLKGLATRHPSDRRWAWVQQSASNPALQRTRCARR